jgi:hypothetical protein
MAEVVPIDAVRVGDLVEPQVRPHDKPLRVEDITYDPHALYLGWNGRHDGYTLAGEGRRVYVHGGQSVRRLERGDGPGAHPPVPPTPRTEEWRIVVQRDGGPAEAVKAVTDTVRGAKALEAHRSVVFIACAWTQTCPGHRARVWCEAPFWPGLHMWETEC